MAGLATVDFVMNVTEMPDSAEKYRAEGAACMGGGGGANAAVAIARLGGDARLIAKIGDDQIGDMIMAGLKAEYVNTSLIHRSVGGKSSFSSVLIDASGERQIVNFRGAGLDATIEPSVLPPCDAILTDNRDPVLTRAMLALADERNIPGVVDAEHPVDMENLTQASHIAFSAQGLNGLTGSNDLAEGLAVIAAQSSAWICVTDGANGVTYMRTNTILHIPAFRIKAVDTLGAGDVWHGAFALGLAEGCYTRSAIKFANAAAALKCQKPGGRIGYPGRAMTEQFLTTLGEKL